MKTTPQTRSMITPLTHGDDKCEVCDGRGYTTGYRNMGMCCECYGTGKKLTEFGRGLFELMELRECNIATYQACYRHHEE